uniref:Uncharacterized protein n=1 Tax=Timema poppense TaxID=170557 RepID=A0A7R9HDC9_TIMPO|nr:unnamed protein product [Timema poppensis]
MITSVSCFSESDKDTSRMAQRRDSVRTESSYKLIEENISLINKLRLKENICRKLENEIEDLEGEIDNVAKTHKEELVAQRGGSMGCTHKTYKEIKEGEVVIGDEKHVTREPWIHPEPSIGIVNPLVPEHRTCDHVVLMSLLALSCQS